MKFKRLLSHQKKGKRNNKNHLKTRIESTSYDHGNNSNKPSIKIKARITFPGKGKTFQVALKN